MRILYLITKSNFGGAQRYVYDLAVAMHNAGHEVTVGFGGHGPLMEKLEAAHVPTVSIPGLERDVNPLADLLTFFRLFDLFGNVMPDVIHLNSSKMGALGALAARVWNGWMRVLALVVGYKHPARIIFTGHGWAFNEERSDLARLLIGSLHWLTVMLAHRTIAVSEKTREQIDQLPLLTSRIRVIHNGIEAAEMLEQQDARLRIFGNETERFLEENPIVIGTIAELHKNKGLSYAIEGIAQLKKQSATPFRYVIIGEGEERTLLEALIRQFDLADTVVLAGYKANASLLLPAFDIFLLPSITEAFPYVILEAGNAGLPVIATAVGGIPEVIDDMESGILIHSKHPGEIARAAGFLIEDERRRAKLGTAIKKRIAGRFNITTMTTATLALYSEEIQENKDKKDSEDEHNKEAESEEPSPHSSTHE